MKTAILDLIREREQVCMAELSREIPGFEGEWVWALRTYTVIWPQVSKEAVESMRELLRQESIFAVPCPVSVYLIDGETLALPIAKNPAHHYRSLRWLPVTFSTAEHCKKKKLI